MIQNGPAAQAGLKGQPFARVTLADSISPRLDNSTADVIVGVDNQKVTTVDDLLSYIENQKTWSSGYTECFETRTERSSRNSGKISRDKTTSILNSLGKFTSRGDDIGQNSGN